MVCCVVNWFSHSPLRMEFTRANAWKVVATSSPLQSELRCLLLDLFFKKRQLYIFNVNKTLYLRDCLSKLIYDQFLTKANIKDFPFLDLKSVWKLGRKLQIMIIFILELWIEKMIENRGGEVDQHLRSSHVQITFYQSIEKNTIRHMIFCQHFFLTFFYQLRLHAKTSIFLCIFLRVEASSYEWMQTF